MVLNVIRDALVYVFRGDGKYAFCISLILSIIANIVTVHPLPGYIAIFLLLAYMCSVYVRVIQTTAMTRSEVPELPGMAHLFSEILWPTIQVTMVVLGSLIPWIMYEIFLDGAQGTAMTGRLLIGLGILYFPMAVLAVVVSGHLGAMNPLVVIPGIFNAGFLYWVSLLVPIGLYILEPFVVGYFSQMIIVGFVIVALVLLFTLMMNGRILGIIYREKKEDLGWL